MTRILYVDDEADILEVAQMALELEADFEVRCCTSGEEALALAQAWKPDLVLLDVMMPAMDGPAVLERLRELAGMESTPVVFITARTQLHEAEHLGTLGAAGVIAKPFDPMTLGQQVREFLP